MKRSPCSIFAACLWLITIGAFAQNPPYTGTVLFEDTFDGTAGSLLNAVWSNVNNAITLTGDGYANVDASSTATWAAPLMKTKTGVVPGNGADDIQVEFRFKKSRHGSVIFSLYPTTGVVSDWGRCFFLPGYDSAAQDGGETRVDTVEEGILDFGGNWGVPTDGGIMPLDATVGLIMVVRRWGAIEYYIDKGDGNGYLMLTVWGTQSQNWELNSWPVGKTDYQILIKMNGINMTNAKILLDRVTVTRLPDSGKPTPTPVPPPPPTPSPTPVAVPTITPYPGTVLFEDTFDGTAGSPPKSGVWTHTNVSLDGSGNAVFDASRTISWGVTLMNTVAGVVPGNGVDDIQVEIRFKRTRHGLTMIGIQPTTGPNGALSRNFFFQTYDYYGFPNPGECNIDTDATVGGLGSADYYGFTTNGGLMSYDVSAGVMLILRKTGRLEWYLDNGFGGQYMRVAATGVSVDQWNVLDSWISGLGDYQLAAKMFGENLDNAKILLDRVTVTRLAAPVPTPTPTPIPTPKSPIAPYPGVVVFEDTFDGTAGSPPNTDVWTKGLTFLFPTNISLDGSGNAVFDASGTSSWGTAVMNTMAGVVPGNGADDIQVEIRFKRTRHGMTMIGIQPTGGPNWVLSHNFYFQSYDYGLPNPGECNVDTDATVGGLGSGDYYGFTTDGGLMSYDASRGVMLILRKTGGLEWYLDNGFEGKYMRVTATGGSADQQNVLNSWISGLGDYQIVAKMFGVSLDNAKILLDRVTVTRLTAE